MAIIRRQTTGGDTLPPLLLRVGAMTREEPPAEETVETVDLGPLSDDLSLALAYGATNVVAVPSVAGGFRPRGHRGSRVWRSGGCLP